MGDIWKSVSGIPDRILGAITSVPAQPDIVGVQPSPDQTAGLVPQADSLSPFSDWMAGKYSSMTPGQKVEAAINLGLWYQPEIGLTLGAIAQKTIDRVPGEYDTNNEAYKKLVGSGSFINPASSDHPMNSREVQAIMQRDPWESQPGLFQQVGYDVASAGNYVADAVKGVKGAAESAWNRVFGNQAQEQEGDQVIIPKPETITPVTMPNMFQPPKTESNPEGDDVLVPGSQGYKRDISDFDPNVNKLQRGLEVIQQYSQMPGAEPTLEVEQNGSLYVKKDLPVGYNRKYIGDFSESEKQQLQEQYNQWQTRKDNGERYPTEGDRSVPLTSDIPDFEWGKPENKDAGPDLHPVAQLNRGDSSAPNPKLPDVPFNPYTEQLESYPTEPLPDYGKYFSGNGTSGAPLEFKDSEDAKNILARIFEVNADTGEIKLKDGWENDPDLKNFRGNLQFDKEQILDAKVERGELDSADKEKLMYSPVTLPDGTRYQDDENQAFTAKENPDRNDPGEKVNQVDDLEDIQVIKR